MSVRLDGYTVWCDDEECVSWIGQVPTRREAVQTAKASGWERRREPGRIADYCPLHRSESPAIDSYIDGVGTTHYKLADGTWFT